MKNNTQFSNVGYGPSSNAAKSRQKVNKLVLIIVYLFAFLGFTFVAVSQATTSWTIVDNYKDFVYPDEYQGLWQKCYDKQAYECVPRKSLTWLYVVRAFHLMAFLLYAVVMGIFIAAHINRNIKPSLAAGFLLVAALLILVGMIVYTAKAPLPRTVDRNRNPYVTREFKIRYGYSYLIGWAGLLLTFMSGIVALVLHRRE
eukprot:Seg1996.6 transcript_id=Seg1996.6/GoldUCD/mRNA.D3Y31 product="Lens fiber membrane intrinsic protein" protein_id=Seg1996.6/GoldUCD/D3Y31